MKGYLPTYFAAISLVLAAVIMLLFQKLKNKKKKASKQQESRYVLRSGLRSFDSSSSLSSIMSEDSVASPSSPDLARRCLPSLPSKTSALFFVGVCSRSQAHKMLRSCCDGTYLVRESPNGGLVFTIIWRKNPGPLGSITHVKIKNSLKDPNQLALADVDAFHTIDDLAGFYQRSPALFAMRFWEGVKEADVPVFSPFNRLTSIPLSETSKFKDGQTVSCPNSPLLSRASGLKADITRSTSGSHGLHSLHHLQTELSPLSLPAALSNEPSLSTELSQTEVSSLVSKLN